MTEAADPRSLITENHILKALTKDQGRDARLISWSLEDFTKKGDNYASFVTSAKVRFTLSGSSREVSYVAKTNPRRSIKALEPMMRSHFRREEMFYATLAPMLDERLLRLGGGRLRYDARGRPCSVALLDFQMATMSSPAIDIIYFLYTSLDEKARKGHQQELLSAYYGTFSEILRKAGVQVPFCLEELHRECRRKMVFGCLMGLIILPAALSESEGCVADPDALTEATMADYRRQQRESLMSLDAGSAAFRSRFLAIFEDLLEIVVQNVSSDS